MDIGWSAIRSLEQSDCTQGPFQKSLFYYSEIDGLVYLKSDDDFQLGSVTATVAAGKGVDHVLKALYLMLLVY